MAYIRKYSSGRWQAVIRKKGCKPMSKTFRTKAAAEDWAKDREDEIERGMITGSAMTVGEMLARYEKEISPRKKGEKKEQSRLRLLEAGLGELQLSQLTPADVVAWADQRLLSVGSDTVRRDIALLSSAIHTAQVLWGADTANNPARIAGRMLAQTRTLKRKVHRERRLQPGEYERLRKELGPEMRALVRLALETAMRRGEIARIEEYHLLPTGLLIEDDKTGKTTVIPVSRRARQILERYHTFNMRPDSITQAFDRACRRAGIDDLRFHDLRHEAASRLFEKGLTIEEVASITRHSDWRSLKRYTHPTTQRITEKLG